MNRLARMLPVAVLIFAAGCARTPEARWMQARAALTEAQDVAIVLHDAGAVDDETLVRTIAPAVIIAREALDRARTLLPDGAGIGAWLDVAESAIVRLVAIRERYAEEARP